MKPDESVDDFAARVRSAFNIEVSAVVTLRFGGTQLSGVVGDVVKQNKSTVVVDDAAAVE